jgi:hypothetical protein
MFVERAEVSTYSSQWAMKKGMAVAQKPAHAVHGPRCMALNIKTPANCK